MCGEIYLSVKLFKRVQALLQRTFLLGFKRLPLVCLLRLNDACISVKVVSVMLKVEPNSTEAICRQEICKNQLSKTKKKKKMYELETPWLHKIRKIHLFRVW